MCVMTISFRHDRGRGYMTTVSEALLFMAMTTYSVLEFHIICMHGMEKISLYFTFTATEARLRETSKPCLKEVVKIAIQPPPPEFDLYQLDTEWWRWHPVKNVSCGVEIEPVLILKKKIIPFRLYLVGLALNGLPIAPSEVYCYTVVGPSVDSFLTECDKLV